MSGGGKLVRALAVLSAAGLAAGVASATVSGTSGAATRTTSAATPKVKVKLIDFKLLPATKKVPVGKVTFVVRNAGAVPHEFVLLKTATPAAKLAVKGGKAVETGRIVRIRAFKTGATKTVTVTLKAGHYVLLCNLPGHYKAGQFADFTVGSGSTGGGSTGGGSTGGGSTGGGDTGGGDTGGSGGGTTTPPDPAKVKAGDALYHDGPAGLGFGCARCHGQLAQGGSGPKVVGKSAAEIQQAIGFVGQMQAFTVLTDSQLENIAAYLQSLGS